MVLGVMKNARLGLTLVLSAGLLSACANQTQYDEVSDPIEPVNRAVLKFNDVVDTAVLKPVAKGYRYAVPQPARTGVSNVLHNLKTPTIVANNVLQGDLSGAGDTLTRFFANTLFGLGGLVDVAGMEGVSYKENDFGMTLGRWGAGSGPYLVLPLLGPSTVRDTTGLVVDTYADPVRLWLHNTDRYGWYYGRVAVASIDKRERLLEVLDDLKKNSIDYYAALRSSYVQNRNAQIGTKSVLDNLPDM